MGKPEIRAVVADLDNTCWDWMGFYIPAMKRFVGEVARIAGTTPDALYPEIRTISQRHGTSEYGWILGEMPTLARIKAEWGDERPIEQIYRPAIEAYCEERDRNLRLYPGVAGLFNELGERKTLRIDFSEGQAFYTFKRLRKTGLDKVLDVIYTPPDTPIPAHADLTGSRSNPPGHYRPRHAQMRTLPKGTKKPNPAVLLGILAQHGVMPQEAVMFGDHLWKDVFMAQQAGVHDAHAYYGDYSRTATYSDFMPKVSFYTDADFEAEKVGRVSAGVIKANVTLAESPMELFDHFNFVRGPRRAPLPRGHVPAIAPTKASPR